MTLTSHSPRMPPVSGPGTSALGPLAAGKLSGQRVERLGERAERVGQPGQPGPGRVQAGLVECVDPPCARGVHAHEAGLPQHPQVL